MVKNESISLEDMQLLFVTDSVDELTDHIKKYSIQKFGLKKEKHKAKWWFWERKR
ncbi:hypothetical protein D3C81_2284550 [compost metagenome]